MFMVFEIRTALPSDAPAACSLLRRSIEECCEPDHCGRAGVLDAWLSNKTPQNVAQWLSAPGNHVLVAERGGDILGLALLTQAGKLALCYVLPGELRQGIGRALLDGIETQARAWNISKLHLHSPESASGFFVRLGYTNAGKEKSCFGLDCDFLWKQLNATAAADGAARKRFCNCNAE
jgi:GNAT superfamily N-acetyltransferase